MGTHHIDLYTCSPGLTRAGLALPSPSTKAELPAGAALRSVWAFGGDQGVSLCGRTPGAPIDSSRLRAGSTLHNLLSLASGLSVALVGRLRWWQHPGAAFAFTLAGATKCCHQRTVDTGDRHLVRGARRLSAGR